MKSEVRKMNQVQIPTNEYRISFFWDDEVGVWIATSEDIHGLILEHSSFDRLLEKVRMAVPELLEMENRLSSPIALDCVAMRKERVLT